jgi:hypothetical protein
VKIGQSITASGLALGIASLTYCIFFHLAFGHAFQRAGRVQQKTAITLVDARTITRAHYCIL